MEGRRGDERRERGNLLLISAFPGSGAEAAGESRSAAHGHRRDAGEGRARPPGPFILRN